MESCFLVEVWAVQLHLQVEGCMLLLFSVFGYVPTCLFILQNFLPQPCFGQSWPPPLCVRSVLIPKAKGKEAEMWSVWGMFLVVEQSIFGGPRRREELQFPFLPSFFLPPIKVCWQAPFPPACPPCPPLCCWMLIPVLVLSPPLLWWNLSLCPAKWDGLDNSWGDAQHCSTCWCAQAGGGQWGSAGRKAGAVPGLSALFPH